MYLTQSDVAPVSPTIPVSDKLGDLQPLITFLLEAKPSKKRIRYAAVSVPEVLDRIVPSGNSTGCYEDWKFFNGMSARVTPARLRAFKNSLKCACCGREGNVFILERHVNESAGQYVNLYSATTGGLALMTVDHILPDCLGGKYSPSNFQTMCQPCNQAKQHIMPVSDIEKVLANKDKYAKHWVNPRLLTAILQTQVMYHNTASPIRDEFLTLFEKYRCNIQVSKPAALVEHNLHNLNRDLAILTYKTRSSHSWFGIMCIKAVYWIMSVIPQKQMV